MAGPHTNGAGFLFVEAYNAWQAEFAYSRLKGWDGQHASQPPALERKYSAMLDALDKLAVETTGQRRPNYVEIARRRIRDEARGG